MWTLHVANLALFFVQAFILRYRNPWKVITDRCQRVTKVRRLLESQSQIKTNYTIKTVIEVFGHQRQDCLHPEAATWFLRRTFLGLSCVALSIPVLYSKLWISPRTLLHLSHLSMPSIWLEMERGNGGVTAGRKYSGVGDRHRTKW